MNAANFATLLRVIAIPVFIWVYYLNIESSNIISAGIFIFACLTDWLDGYLARKLNQASKFGAFLDPVADKLLVTVTLVMLAGVYTDVWFVIPAAIMVAREVLVSALREWMADNQQRNVVAVSWVGKVKTTVQMLAIIVFLAAETNGPIWFINMGYILLFLATLLTLWSMLIYLKSAWPLLTSELK